jgi:hypothetical protein
MSPSAPANSPQRQQKPRVDREREAMVGEQWRDSRNAAATEKSLVDRLLGTGGRKKKS